ncbi:MAG: glycerol kinase GlpK [Proteobacteria bacterium]|nr:glycerol kinase GlpK [Pseudomonadota bacterium]
MKPCLLSIDQGTTSSRAMLFDENGRALYTAQQEFKQYFPHDGWVEHDPEEIWSGIQTVIGKAIKQASHEELKIAAAGITNQRETTVIWNRKTGKPLYNAIVWQDRRTAERCNTFRVMGHQATVTQKTGLLLDPYFSASKIAWVLDNVEGARVQAEQGELAFGTIDCFLIWRLTAGRVHATDASNASRTMLFNIHDQSWDQALLKLFDIPGSMLPEVFDCAADYGFIDKKLFAQEIPIAGVAGDQQSALIGQACFQPGMLKSTYGTGCFLVMNTGEQAVLSQNKLLTTVAYRLNGVTHYALEGSIFIAGAAIQWLRDGLGIIQSARETEALVADTNGNNGVYMVPAFTGLGAPHWDADARGAVFGITRDTGVSDFVRAALESVCYQTVDLLGAMQRDAIAPGELRVDGGMVSNDWLCQFLANVLNVPVTRPVQTETTALGAAYLAGLQVGIFDSVENIEKRWQIDEKFLPLMQQSTRAGLLKGWNRAVSRVLLK